MPSNTDKQFCACANCLELSVIKWRMRAEVRARVTKREAQTLRRKGIDLVKHLATEEDYKEYARQILAHPCLNKKVLVG